MASSDSGAMWPGCCSTSFIQFSVNVLVSRKVTCAVHVQHSVIPVWCGLCVASTAFLQLSSNLIDFSCVLLWCFPLLIVFNVVFRTCCHPILDLATLVATLVCGCAIVLLAVLGFLVGFCAFVHFNVVFEVPNMLWKRSVCMCTCVHVSQFHFILYIYWWYSLPSGGIPYNINIEHWRPILLMSLHIVILFT